MNRNYYLTGFMGAGKTTVGRALAETVGRPFVDLDQVLEERLGEPISRVFETKGEDYFRSRETELLQELAVRKRCVVATGGGLPLRDENRSLMRKSGLIIHLRTDLETCRQRVAGTGTRPLWKDGKTAERLYRFRAPVYADNDLELRTETFRPPGLARKIVVRLLGEESFRADLGGAECGITATFEAPRVLESMAGERRVFILTDRKVGRLHLEKYAGRLRKHEVMTVPGGERIKTMATLKRIYEKLLALSFNRDDLFLALGGGAVTDLGAFAAATYKRGMSLALASTTLLGCVDAAIGGKAAVNAGRSKNMIGCFTAPEKVLLDLASLRTLGSSCLREGLVEAYKTGLAASPELAGLIETETGPLLEGDLPGLARIVTLSARAKADIVDRDYREGNLRMVLNLGHTFGHVVETWHNFRVSHGLAVATGLIAALKLSCRRGLLEPEAADRMIGTVRKICGRLPGPPPMDQAWRMMGQDKKNKRGKMVFILLKEAGQPMIVDDLQPEELEAALFDIKEGY